MIGMERAKRMRLGARLQVDRQLTQRKERPTALLTVGYVEILTRVVWNGSIFSMLAIGSAGAV